MKSTEIVDDVVIAEFVSGRMAWFFCSSDPFSVDSAIAMSALGRGAAGSKTEADRLESELTRLRGATPVVMLNPFLLAFRAAQRKRDADR